MSRHASPDELRVAYRALARELHPDRHHDSPGPTRQVAASRMAEVNAAWRVLSDEHKRRTYDLELALAEADRARPSYGPAATGRRPTSGASGRAPSGSYRPTAGARSARASAAYFDEVDVVPGERAWTTIFRAFPWLVVVLILGGIFVFTAFAASNSGEGTRPGSDGIVDATPTTVPPYRPQRGDCVRVVDVVSLDIVDCSAPNSGRIVELAPPGRPCPQGATQRIWLPDEGLDACITPA